MLSKIVYQLLPYLESNDIGKLQSVSKELNSTIDDDIWKHKAHLSFSTEFWRRASQRPKLTSEPKSTWKEELIRIYNFNKKLKQYKFSTWNEEDYYLYWDLIDHY